MPITQQDIKNIAHLARLELEESLHGQSLANEITQIVALVDQIQALDTKGTEPMSHPLEGLTQPMREDLVTEPNLRDALQELAPTKEAGYYLVPQVIE